LRIKKLELFGFKSFKDRTVIQFDEGITGIVGPNGCGKSNIVDALIWVMGEMSAKHLRGASMSDVIFAGAEGYAPMGMAEVSLTLENDGGPFPAQYARFSEIMVTRRLNRDGESEYFINKEPSRLRDIQEIFMDTGAGSKGFSIIEQGAIGKIITSKPEDRRVLIEEAAGITKFKVRKRESQRKLESTDQNLVRLQDIIGEQKRQIDSLERQAQRAERYRKIKTELQDKDMWLAAQNYTRLHVDTVAAETTFQSARDFDAGNEGRVAELDAQLSALRLELAEKEQAVQQQMTSHRELLTRTQECDFRIRELNMAIDQARRSNEMTGSILAQHGLRRENLESEKETLELKLIEAREEALLLEQEYQTKNTAFVETQERITKIDLELTDRRREMLALSASRTHLEAREGVLKGKVEELDAKLVDLRLRVEEIKQKRQEFEARRNKIFQQLDGERQMHMDHVRDVDLLQENLLGLKAQIQDHRQTFETNKDELNQVASRLYGLENLQSNFEGFEEGVKNVMLWQRSRAQATEAGVATESFKPLAEVIEVPQQFELAMEASLGTRLQMLLSDSSDHALGAVDYLKTQKSGRSSFLSADASGVAAASGGGAQSLQIETSLRTEPGFQSFLKDVVSVPEKISHQVAHIFQDVAIVDSIRTALRLRTTYPDKTFVTLDGDVLSRDGILTGGAAETVDTGVLKRRREIKELSLKREELAGKVQLAQLSLKKLEQQEEGLREQLELAKKTAVEKEILIASLRKDLERAENELTQATSAAERESAQSNAAEQEQLNLGVTLRDLQTQLAETRQSLTGLEENVNQLSAELETSKAGIEGRAKEVSDLRVQSVSRKQEAEGLERQLMLVQSTYQDVISQLEQMSAESERNSTTLTTSQIEVESLQTQMQRLIHETQEAELAVGQVRNQFELCQASVRAQDEELSSLRSQLNQQRAQMNEAQLRMEQLRMKETYLVEQIHERYMVNLREVAQQYIDADAAVMSPESLTEKIELYSKEVEELRDKLKRIGEVNLSAIQEYDEVIKRYEFLNQQYNDLLEAKENLRKVIERINRICSKRFKETFEQVNERFQKVFPVLFGGGEASLILIDGPEMDDPGIDIMARPPGKKLQNVTLLSGGEKALTAVSLIFSIFLVKPSPFCLLDEVDAPLDDANVFRFNDLVKEMAKRSQIIVVTHNKHTMKVNKKLYGVTMQEKGVSKMVSVSLADAEKIAQS